MKRFAKWLLVPGLLLAAWGVTSSSNDAEAGWGYYRRPFFAPVPIVRPYPVYRSYYYGPPAVAYPAYPVYPAYPAYAPVPYVPGGVRINIGW